VAGTAIDRRGNLFAGDLYADRVQKIASGYFSLCGEAAAR
jgi:hypothetical protein